MGITSQITVYKKVLDFLFVVYRFSNQDKTNK